MKIDITPFQHFSFDLWLTLIKSNPLFKKKRDQLFIDFFSIEYSIDKVSEVVRSYDKVCNKINDKTGIHIETNQLYCLILNDLGVNIDKIEVEKLEEFYQETANLFINYKPLLVYPSINKLFKEIQSNGKSASILSNTAFIKGHTLRKVLTHYELESYFSFQLYSDEIGYSKPHQKAFELLLNKADKINTESIGKNTIVHIGDNIIADYQGAIKSGIQSILIKN